MEAARREKNKKETAVMETLGYDVLKRSGYTGYLLQEAPEKVLQFGEGNFLRAFVNYWFDVANEKAGWNGKCCLVQPIAPGLAKLINAQQGFEVGTRIIMTAMVDSGGQSVIGGGHTGGAAERFDLADRFSYVSTGGGALETFLLGEPLPVVEALKYSRREFGGQ